jgi:hypothetical protein
MYTSCAWFFDEVSGIETVQVMQYACRAIQLAETESNRKLLAVFTEKLAAARSNLPEYGNGAAVYERFVTPSQLTLTQIGMHYAVSALFAEDPNEISVFNYRCRSDHFKRIVQGYQRLAVGRTWVNSTVTLSEKNFSYVILYIGQHHLIGKAFEDIPLDEYHLFVEEVISAFTESNISKVIELFRKYPEQRSFSFFDMFKDEQIKMLQGILEYNMELAKSSYEKINDRNYNIINVMHQLGLNPPKMLVRNLEVTLQSQLHELFDNDSPRINIVELKRVVSELRKWEFDVNRNEMNFLCAQKFDKMVASLGEPVNGKASKLADVLRNMRNALELLAGVGIYPELNNVQDCIFHMLLSSAGDETDETKNELYQFGEYINLDVSRFRVKNQKLKA